MAPAASPPALQPSEDRRRARAQPAERAPRLRGPPSGEPGPRRSSCFVYRTFLVTPRPIPSPAWGSRILALELGDEGLQDVALWPAHFGLARHDLGDRKEHLRRLAGGIGLGDHLAIVRGGAENRRIEGNVGERLRVERPRKFSDLDLRAFRHAHHIEHEAWRRVVAPQLAERVEEVLGVT